MCTWLVLIGSLALIINVCCLSLTILDVKLGVLGPLIKEANLGR